MSTLDILIVYLAFGSPLVVYRYLADRGPGRPRRMFRSILTLAFWVPLAAQMGYRRLINAYSRHSFVSQWDLDSIIGHVEGIRAALNAQRKDADPRGRLVGEFLQSLERFIALSLALRDTSMAAETAVNFFALVRADGDTAAACFVRRNRRRVENHHIRARADLLSQLENVSYGSSAATVTERMVEIASLLDDQVLAGFFANAGQKKERIWNAEQPTVSENKLSTLTQLAITIPPPNSD